MRLKALRIALILPLAATALAGTVALIGGTPDTELSGNLGGAVSTAEAAVYPLAGPSLGALDHLPGAMPVVTAATQEIRDLDAQRPALSMARLTTAADWRLEQEMLRDLSQHAVRVGKGDTLMGLLTDSGVAREDALATVDALKAVYDPRRLWPGQEIVLNFDPFSEGAKNFEGLTLDRSYDRQIVVARADGNAFTAKEQRKNLSREPLLARGVIESSLFAAGERAGLPAAILVEMIRAYSFDVDFQREIRKGDSFEVLYERLRDDSGEVVNQGRILYANLVRGGKATPIFRFTPKSGISDFFHSNGQSVRKALLRTPIDGARVSSGFGKRRHPILGYNKMHKGLDFAAARGTPIYAAGHGVVEHAGRNGAYGNYVRIRHTDTYKTAYAHMSRVGRGIRPGTKVQQGQVIGYVGTTGRSTGPHLHYEVLVNGRQVSPQSVKLPAGEKLKGADLEQYRVAKARIEKVYANIAGVTRLAQNLD